MKLEPLEDLLYDVVCHGKEHPWRTWAKAQRQKEKDAGQTHLTPMVAYLVEWRKQSKRNG